MKFPLLAYCFSLLFVSGHLHGQGNYYRSTRFQSITVNDGLAHRTCHDIVQDQEGYIWLATNNGLNRYDGRNLRTYRKDIQDEYSLPDNRINHLLAAVDGKLWIISGPGELSWHDPSTDRFINLSLQTRDREGYLAARRLSEGTDGNIYLLAGNQQLYRIELSPENPQYPNLIPIKSLRSAMPPISSFLTDRYGRIWVATSNREIQAFRLDGNQLNLIKSFSYSESFRLLNIDEDRLWLLRQQQLYLITLDDEQLQPKLFLDLAKLDNDLDFTVREIRTDSQGQLWVATMRDGLIRIDSSRQPFSHHHFPGTAKDEFGISNNRPSNLFIDKYNVLWVGTQVGVFRTSLNQKPFYQISKVEGNQNSITDNIVHSVFRDDFIWIGTRNGLSVIDTTSGRVHNYRRLPLLAQGEDYGGVSCIFKDSRGRMWMGTGSKYLYQIQNPDEPHQLRFTPINEANSNFTAVNINNLLEDDLGRIWVGTTYEGIYVLNEARESQSTYQFTHLSKLPDLVLSNMYKDPFENTIWTGTAGHGLLRISIDPGGNYFPEFFQNKPGDPNSLSLDHTNPIVRTAPDTLWVGTIGGGLNRLTFTQEGRIEYKLYTTHDGLSDNTIHSIQTDHNGNLWLAGTGLSRFDPDRKKITHFTKQDGLQSNLFIVNSSFKDQHGRLYFGGPYGLNFFFPEAVRGESSYPDIAISSLKILNESIEIGAHLNGRVVLDKPINQVRALQIKEKENDLTFELLALHHAAPSKNRLRYRLLGHTDEWIDVPDMHATINYSNLRSGAYTLQVMAANGDDIWSPNTKELPIIVLPYWYKTGWAYLGYGLLFVLLMLLFRRNVIMQSNLRNHLKIAEIKLEKDREVAEMKTRFFNNITHELRTPLTLIQGPVEELLSNDHVLKEDQKNYHRIIHRNAHRLLDLVNRLLDFRKAETGHFKLKAAAGDLIPFAREIYLSFQQLAKEQDIRYSFEAPSQMPLYFDGDKMEIVLCNLLSNAFKYTKPGDSISMLISQGSEDCLIELKDTGKGIPANERDLIFDRFYQIARTESSQIIGTGIGLSMVKGIIDLHRGNISVTSAPGRGSTFSIRLPLGRAHLYPEQIVAAPPSGDQIGDYNGINPTGTLELPEPEARGKTTDEPLQRLLIVEDNPEIRRFICTLFRQDFELREAVDGVSGLALLKTYQPDLIISDIMMDPMDGITFCTRLREDPDLFHIPLILLTARTSHVYQVDGLSSGADAYITKPFNGRVLQAQVHSLLRSRTSLRQYYADRITLAPKKIDIPSEEMIFLEELIATIEEKLESEDLTAEGLATAMAMSHSTLYRRIKTYTGESINAFIRSIRLKQAAQLLIDSDLNVTQIAFKVGFSDVNYFGKCFKRQFKVSPSTYAKTKQQ